MTPTVSVCMPVYNCEETIEACVRSVLQQSFTDFECVVVDNASTDSTFDRIAAIGDSRVRAFRNPENIGPVPNHNRCIQYARGELIQFLHSDDRFLDDYLIRLVPTFDDRRVGLAFARRRVQPADSEWASMHGFPHNPLAPLSSVNQGMDIVRSYVNNESVGNWIGEPSSVMVRRSLLEQVGGFNPELRYADDLDLWLRILARSDAAWLDVELSVRTHDDGTLTATYDRTGEAWLDRAWMLSGLAGNRDLDRKLRMKARRGWFITVLKNGVRAQQAPADVRAEKFRQLRRHVRMSLKPNASAIALSQL